MTLAVRLSVGFAIASALVYVTTPYAISLADRLHFYDKPEGYKGHARPTPYLGGVAVMAGFIVAVVVTAGHWSKTAPLLGGVVILLAVGTIDDRRTVSASLRVALELALGAGVWAVGLGWDLHAGGALDLVLTCMWTLAVVNAFNLFDNMDGAAATMALVVCVGAAFIGVVRGDAWLGVSAACLCGACLGFLPRNLSRPARIFLGDGGSMPMGFAVAVLVMAAAGTSTIAWRSLLVALLLIAIPALDTSLVIVSRRRRGVSVLSGGRDHLTHRARRFLPSERAVALSLGALQAAMSALAVLASRGEASLVVICASLYLLVAGVAIVVLDTQRIEEFGLPPLAGGVAMPVLSKRAFACLLVLGLGAGISPFFYAYYDSGTWVPIGLGVVLVCAIAVVIRPARPGAPAALTLAGLLGLGAWSLASSAWAESVENAVVSGNRWLVYGALLVLMLVLVSHDRRALVLFGAAGVGVCAVALSVLARLLGSDPATLFLGGRLNSPLGYINGEGCLFVMGVWLCVAAAETRRAVIAGPAMAMATLMACLALLTQSRGTAIAMIGSLIVVVALVPERTRRCYGLLAVGAGVAAAAPDLLHVYDYRLVAAVPVDVGHGAARAALVAAIAVGVAWALLTAAWEAFASPRPSAPLLRTTGSWLLLVPVVAALALGVSSTRRIERDVRTQAHAFVHLYEPGESGSTTSSAGQARLLSGGGNRYDYWRIAWHVWREHPLLGVGAGNYPRSYYERRATTEDIEQPHSLELQALSELGLVGALLLLAFLGGVAWGMARMRRRAARSALSRGLMVGAVGVFTAWLVQTSVDWMHLLPGLSAIALAAIAVLVWPRAQGARQASRARSRIGRELGGRPALAVGVSALVVTLIVAGASLSRQGLADLYRTQAQNELQARPAAALSDAERSLDIDDDSLQAYYLKAAALARFDQAAAAEATLGRALAREPENFVTWALLGDIAVRERSLRAASRDYGRAHALNPRDATLRELAVNPRLALR